ncbi:cytochrome P450 [Rhodococcus sp. D2-41]|uniref:cytochrome P450 n=1 Tax=Speluncibacter jeojiensis TaxID=2710754 RepID=UPI00240F8F6C|nr:cytochrome P450 [Rhodococcus sp. D2-41]MDG3008810.1 cytochrome P450 [Rhodococcus sp. D2-41]
MTGVLAPPPVGSDLRAVPGVGGIGVVETLRAMHDPRGVQRERYRRLGPVSWSSTLGVPVVGLQGPDAAQAVLVNRDEAFASGPAWGYFIGPFFRRGLMLLDFDEHHHHRMIMQDAFGRPQLRGYLDAMGPGIERGLDGWLPGAGFRVYPHLKQLTLDLAVDAFLGLPLDPGEQDRLNAAFVDTVRAGTAIVRHRVPGLRWSRGLRGRAVLEDFFHGALPGKRAAAECGDGTADLFAQLCRAESADGHRFDDADVVNHMIFALMAAHDTTTITMTSMAYFMAKHPRWQERAREQSVALDRPVLDYADLERMDVLDMVMRESLRMCPPVPAIPRRTVADTEVFGYFLPAGTFVAVANYTNHFLPEYWPEPDRFDPERFAPDRREDRVHRYAWAPFGGGAHKCIGMYFGMLEVKSVFHQLLRRFRWTVPDDYRWPLDVTSLPRPRDGLPVTLSRL